MPQPPGHHSHSHNSLSALHGSHAPLNPHGMEHGLKNQHTESKFPAGSLRLPFNMLKIVLDELSDRLSLEEPLSETEASTMVEFASELQNLATKSNSKEAEKAFESSEVAEQQEAITVAELEDWQKELVSIFKELDGDASGSLSTDEVRRALVVAEIPQARVTKLLRFADADNSGEVSLDEWIRAITKSGSDEMRELSRRLQQKRTLSGHVFDAAGSGHRCMLHPFSRIHMSWEVCISAACVYIAIWLPFFIAFEELFSDSTVEALRVTDEVINCMFIADVVLNFRTGFLNADGEMIMDGRRAAIHYLRTWFLWDVLSSFPFEYVTAGRLKHMQAFKLVKMFKLLKVLKLIKPRSVDLTELSDFFEDLSQSKAIQMMYRRSGVIVHMCIICHWMACGTKVVDEKMLKEYKDGAVSGDVWSEYLASLYFSMTTITTVGYGDMAPQTDSERLYVTIAMVIGGGFYGYVVGSIASMVANNDLNASAYYERMDLIHAWLIHHRLPMSMKRSLRRYFKAYLSEKSAVSEAEIWHDLSPELQREVGEYIMDEDVKHHPLFDGLSIGCVVRLQSILQMVTVLSGHQVTTKGEAGTAMYIIVSGSLLMDASDQDNKEIGSGEERNAAAIPTCKLGPGQSFGEEVLLGFIEIFSYTVTVLEKSKLQMILEDEFLMLFQAMPNVLERMRQNALELNPHWDKLRLAS